MINTSIMICSVANYCPQQLITPAANGFGKEREGQAGVLTSTCDLRKVRNEVRVPVVRLQVFHCCSTDSQLGQGSAAEQALHHL